MVHLNNTLIIVIIFFSWVLSYYLSFQLLLFFSYLEGSNQIPLLQEFRLGYEELVEYPTKTNAEQIVTKLSVMLGESPIGITVLSTFVLSLWLTPLVYSIFSAPIELKNRRKEKVLNRTLKNNYEEEEITCQKK